MSNKNRAFARKTVRVVTNTKKKKEVVKFVSQLPKSQPKCCPSLAYIQTYIIDAHKLNLVCTAGQFEGSWLVTLGSNWLSSTSVELRISKELLLHFSDLCSFGRDAFVLLRHSGFSGDGIAGWRSRGYQ